MFQDAKPQEFLANYNSLKFDKQSAMVRDAKETTDEIRTLCDDLMVLNKGDFRALLKWRSAVRPLLVQDADSDEEGSSSGSDVDSEDEKLSKGAFRCCLKVNLLRGANQVCFVKMMSLWATKKRRRDIAMEKLPEYAVASKTILASLKLT